MDTNFIDVSFDLKDRKLKNPNFINMVPKNTNLSDIVVCYNDGKLWKIIPLKIISTYPIIVDNYFQDQGANNGEIEAVQQITVYMCPYTLFSCLYFGEYKLYEKLYITNVALVNEKDKDQIIIPILNKT